MWSVGSGASTFGPHGFPFGVFADGNIAATEDMTIDELIKSILEEATVDSTSDTDSDDCGCVPYPVAIPVVDNAP